MALTFASYAISGPHWLERAVAFAAVVALTAANYHGIARTAGLARLLVGAAIAAIAIALAAIAFGRHAGAQASLSQLGGHGAYGMLQAAGLLFFAFAGYARIATLGEEVRDPLRTIPRAIPVALAVTVVLYFAVGIAALAAAGPTELGRTTRPLALAVATARASWALPIVRTGAAVASLGALLALIAGVGRTVLAMARNGDLPRALDSVHPRYRVPDRAELAVCVAASLLVLTTDLRGAIGFSSFGVLVYYAIANASAYTQPAEERRWPRTLNVAGVIGCVALVATLPLPAVIAGLAMFAVGLAGRAVAARFAGRTPA
jgi:basic amino acid/polyamine antiporter, APA family